MIRYLVSDFGNYEKKDGHAITHPIDNLNGIVNQFILSIRLWDMLMCFLIV